MSLNNVYYVDMKKRFNDFQKETPKNLLGFVSDLNNIQLAYRKLRESKGAYSKGTDGTNIDSLEEYSPSELSAIVYDRIINKKILPVRRIYIEKDNGKKRPLGIASIWDKLTQMCIKLVIEPIAEQTFVPSSFGFREQVTAHQALAKVRHYSNLGWNYMVNIDMKDYFGTLKPDILYRELYSIGIRDKYILNYIYRLVHCGFIGQEGFYETDCGVPQGSVLGPLLSNIYLHSTDVWIRDQFEDWHDKSVKKFISESKSRNFQKTKLKLGVHVRYADDMLVICKTYDDAVRWFHAVVKRLNKHLGLIVNEDKSSIINLVDEEMTYLGYTFYYNNEKRLSAQKLSSKKISSIVKEARSRLRALKKEPTQKKILSWNAFVRGLHNYFGGMTQFYESFSKVQWRIHKLYRHVFQGIAKVYKPNVPHDEGMRKILDNWGYRSWGRITFFHAHGFPILLLNWANWDKKLCGHAKQKVKRLNPYDYGINQHKPSVNNHDLIYLVQSSQKFVKGSMKYRDFRVSKYSSCKGMSYISGDFVPVKKYHCHHIIPKSKGGTDDWDNLCVLNEIQHRLLHSNSYMVLMQNCGVKYKKRLKELIYQIHGVTIS